VRDRDRDRDRDQKSVMRPRQKNYETKTSPVKSVACESNTNRYVLFFYYTHDEPEMDFAFKMISK